MKVYIIRHGEPDYSIDSLTPKGWKEAEFLSQRIAKLSIDDFYCSPLGRAKDTAKPSMEKLNREYKVLDWLQEFRGVITSPFSGDTRIMWDLPPYFWGNKLECYHRENWKNADYLKNSNVCDVYEETITQTDALLKSYGLERDGMIYKGESDKSIALFCHFGMGSAIISHLLGLPFVAVQHNFFLPPSSVTTLVTETDSKGYVHFRATGIGDISHLYANGEEMSQSGLYPDFEE